MVSINPCTDAILVQVAEKKDISALSAWSSDPASSSMDVTLARRYPSTAGTAEELIALHPRLVIGGTFTSPATRNALARQGIPLVELPIARTVEESEAQIRQIAALTHTHRQGEALIARIEAAITASKSTQKSSPSAVIWQSGGIVAGEGTLIADLLHRTGFSSYSAAKGLKQADYLPLERVLADPPQVILAAGNPAANEDRLLAHPALARLPNTRRERLDSKHLWCGGPTIIAAATRLAEIRRTLP